MGKSTRTTRHRHVALFVDALGVFGRGLLQGIADYMDTHERWSLFVEQRATAGLTSAWLNSWRGDGVLAFVWDRRLAARLRTLKIPIVEIVGYLGDVNLPCVGIDEVAVGCVGAEHFLQRQLKHFAFSGYPKERWSDLRHQGFRRVLNQSGYDCSQHHHPQTFAQLRQWERAQQKLTAWLKDLPKPVGLMACSDRHAQMVLDAAQRAEIKVPDELAVLGTDNDETICRLTWPPLSSIVLPAVQVGYEAAKMLDRLMAGRVNKAKIEPRLIPPKGVVTRRSSDMTVVDDPRVADALRLMREQACESLNVNELLRQVPMSRSTFYRQFREAVGRSPHEEILRIRLERVKELLTQTSLPVTRIAEAAGFEHTEYMVAVFRKHEGVTPGRYRAEQLS